MRPLPDLLLSTDPVQRQRLAQIGLALLLLAAAVLALQYFAWAGLTPAAPLRWWALATWGGMLGLFLLVRCGLSRRFRDPSLAVPQMVFVLTSAAVAYLLLGPGRGAVFPVVMVVLMFGLFVATPRQLRRVGVYAVLLFGLTMALGAWRWPQVFDPAVELGHFLLLALMLPVASRLAARLAEMRRRARAQRAELTQALTRLREQSTRDELTGLINRRHMLSLLEQEQQRCMRSGQTFCLAVLDIDAFKRVNDEHGYAVGDAVLRALAQEAQRQVRGADLVARWGGEDFVLMLPDTRVALARGGLERLQQRMAALRILHGDTTVAVTLSAGLAEHHAGEAVTTTLERAKAALGEAKTAGPGHLAVAA